MSEVESLYIVPGIFSKRADCISRAPFVCYIDLDLAPNLDSFLAHYTTSTGVYFLNPFHHHFIAIHGHIRASIQEGHPKDKTCSAYK